MRKHFPAWLVLLGAVTAIGPLSIDMYLPGFVAIAEGLATTRGAVERSLPVFLAGLALGQLVYGPLSDRFGRRAPLVAGLAIYVAGSLGCAGAASMDALSAWRLVQALGAAAGMVIARAVIRDRLDPRASARAMSTLMLVMGVAPILAPLAGSGVLTVASWRGIFLFQAVFGLLCLGWAFRTMQDSRSGAAGQGRPFGQVLRTYGALLCDRRLTLPALCSGFAFAGMFAYIASSPFVLMKLYGLTSQEYGLVFGLNSFGLVATSQLNGLLLRHRDPYELLRASVWVPAVSGVAMLAVSLSRQAPLPLLIATLFCYLAGLGMIGPNAGAIAMAEQGQVAGAASALMGTLSFIVGMAAGFAVSAAGGATAVPLALIIAACGVMTAVLGVWTLRVAHAPVPAAAVVEPPPVI
ncbi:MAG: multidrug effflux MFS transporter [Panacagrimonas sp.]